MELVAKRGKGRPSLFGKELTRDGLTQEQEQILRKVSLAAELPKNMLLREAVAEYLHRLGYSLVEQGLTKE